MENDVGAVRIFGIEIHLVEELNDVVLESDSSPRTDPDLSALADLDSAGDGVAGEEGLDSFRCVRLDEGGRQFQIVKTTFVKAMSGVGLKSAAEAVYKSVFRGVIWQARHRSFIELSTQHGLDKVKYAWFGGSKEEISNVMRYGFASKGRGISLSPIEKPTFSLRHCVADEDGLYHMILCRAIPGKPELLRPGGCAQRFATSEDSYAGVDNLESPGAYFVWSSYMNSHVMPHVVVSFKPPVKAARGPASASARAPVAVNPVDPVRANEGAEIRRDLFLAVTDKVIDELASVLPASAITRLRKLNGDLKERNIPKAEMSQNLRQLAGVDLLRTVTASAYRDVCKNMNLNAQGPVSASARAPVAVNPVGAVRANEGAAPRRGSNLVSGLELVQEISSVLPASTVTRLREVHLDCCLEKKITKEVMFQKLKQIAGARVFDGAWESLKRKRGMTSSASKAVKKPRREGSP